MSARGKLGVVAGVVLLLVGIAVLASGSVLGLFLLLVVVGALAFVARRSGREAEE